MADALVNAANTKLDELVADGRLQQDRADTIKGKVPARVDKLVNRHFGAAGARPEPTELPRTPPRRPPAPPARRASPRSC